VPKRTDARERTIATTAKLMQRQGYAATGLTQILEVSGAPKGSFYFHFPDGKEQLATEAVRLADAQMRALIGELLDQHPSPKEAVDALADTFAAWLARSDYTEGCPITTVALEQSATSPALQQACSDAFRSWQQLLAQHFRSAGHPHAAADHLATLVVCALEGAFVIARSTRSRKPFRDCKRSLAALLIPPPVGLGAGPTAV
jgi:TetR/AcrR family transcriptional repressor of lmrAB and yxaGH operons